MKEHPILFNGEMVRAILDGQKTQTRRAVGRVSADCELFVSAGGEHWQQCFRDDHGRVCGKSWLTRCPYGQPGDRLWVREAFFPDPPILHDGWDNHHCTGIEWSGCGRPIKDVPKVLQAPQYCIFREGWTGGELVWRPSIHMPRWACRILLDVVSVRVERLQDISEEDAIAEGVAELPFQEGQPGAWWAGDVGKGPEFHARTPVHAFRKVWDSTYAARGLGWDANPWVWVIEFTRAEATA